MGRREDVNNAIWSDPDFEALSAYATLLYFWSFTNSRCGMAGLYKVSRQTMTESKIPLDAMGATLDELAEAGFAFHTDNVLWIRTRVKHLRVKSPQMAKSVANDVAAIRFDHPLRVRFLDVYGSEPWLRDALKANINRYSVEVHESAYGKGDHVNFKGTSTEVPGKRQGSSSSCSGSSSRRKPRRAVDQEQPPSSLPEELRPVVDEVLAMLEAIYTDRGGNQPTVRGVGLAVDAHRDCDHVAVARELQHWALAGTGQGRPVTDWARTYATFLKGAPKGKPVAFGDPRKESPSDLLRAIQGGRP